MGGARGTGAPSGLALAPRSNDPSTPRTRSTNSPARNAELVPRGQRNGEILVADRENDPGAVAVHSCTSSTVGYAVALHRYLTASEESPTRGQTPPRSLLESDIGSHANAVGSKCMRQDEGRARIARSKRPRIRPDARPPTVFARPWEVRRINDRVRALRGRDDQERQHREQVRLVSAIGCPWCGRSATSRRA
jgi:hypothetical protein